MKDIISALSKALNEAESELSSALLDGDKFKEGAGKVIEDKLAARVTKLTTEAEAKRQRDVENAKGKATKETAEKFEKAIHEHLGLDKTLKGDDLLSMIPESLTKLKTDGDDPVKIKASTTYIEGIRETENRLKQEYEGKINEKEKSLTELQANIAKEKVQSAVLAKAREFSDALNLRTDIPKETVAALKATAEGALLRNNFKILENGDLIIVDDKGEMMKDSHGHSLKLDSLITEAYKPLDVLKVAGPARKDGGAGEGGAGAGGNSLTSLGFSVPKTVEEYNSVLKQIAEKNSKKEISSDVAAKLSEEAQTAVLEATKAK